jgi:hypothetical protein
LIDRYQCFRGMLWLLPVPILRTWRPWRWRQHFHLKCLYLCTWSQILEDGDICSHCCENLKFNMCKKLYKVGFQYVHCICDNFPSAKLRNMMVLCTRNLESEFVIVDGFQELQNYVYFHKTGMHSTFSCCSEQFICLPFGIPVLNCTGLLKVKLLVCVLYNLFKNMSICSYIDSLKPLKAEYLSYRYMPVTILFPPLLFTRHLFICTRTFHVALTVKFLEMFSNPVCEFNPPI